MSEDIHFQDLILTVTSPLSLTLRRLSDTMLQRRIIGGVFGRSGFEMASWITQAAGLHEVLYLVRDEEHRLIFFAAKTRAEALNGARAVLAKVGSTGAINVVKRYAALAAAQDADKEYERLRHEKALEQAAPTKLIPKRRRQVFAASNGECHYCRTALVLDGKWHIEHRMPRALMGGNEPSNLVAACLACNYQKRDMTDVEFIAAAGLNAPSRGKR